MREKVLNKRQESILASAEKRGSPIAIGDVSAVFDSVARITVVRDLKLLSDFGYLTRVGRGRGSAYRLSDQYELIKPIDREEYFSHAPDERRIKNSFNFDIFKRLRTIFQSQEIAELEKLNRVYRQNVKSMSAAMLKKEYERLTIELSWKSSQMEGNTYTLLETEYLFKEQREPRGHTREETTMILNHKAALDHILSAAGKFQRLSLAKIEDVHYLLTKEMGVRRNLRQRLVRITGTSYKPLDNQHQIREAIEQTCQLINKQKNFFDKAVAAMLLIAYIQPFEDGNKRTSRLIGNALLLAGDICPLSFRSIDELEYKKAILLFYEQNNLRYFKELFIQQFEFAVKNYFG